MTGTIATAATVLLGLLVVSDAVDALRGPRRGGGVRPVQWMGLAVRVALVAALSALLVARSVAMRFPALVGRFDSRLFFAAIILAVVAVLEVRAMRRGDVLPAAVRGLSTLAAFLLVAIASAPGIPMATPIVLPALRSMWLPLHVAFTFVGEALFVVAAAMSTFWLVQRARGVQTDLRELDALTYRMIAVGYAFFTVGALVFGAIWGHQAWGRWWGWDPKETWSLITWLVYSIYLHARLLRWGRGAVAHWLSVGGFLATVFTLFGVNLLYSSIHAY